MLSDEQPFASHFGVTNPQQYQPPCMHTPWLYEVLNKMLPCNEQFAPQRAWTEAILASQCAHCSLVTQGRLGAAST